MVVFWFVALLASTTARRIDYDIKGAIEVDTNENSLFLWHETLFLLENIPCYYSEHNGQWNASYANASYAVSYLKVHIPMSVLQKYTCLPSLACCILCNVANSPRWRRFDRYERERDNLLRLYHTLC